MKILIALANILVAQIAIADSAVTYANIVNPVVEIPICINGSASSLPIHILPLINYRSSRWMSGWLQVPIK
jgi:hypothetical protein